MGDDAFHAGAVGRDHVVERAGVFADTNMIRTSEVHRTMPDPLELLPALEQQAYRILVKFDWTRPDDLAELTGLPQAEATRLLWSLHARGPAAAQPGEESAFRPLPPDVALGNHLMRRHEALEQARQLVAELKDAYQAGVRRFKPTTWSR
ncbi:helix-turn-helix domain-containing protein [Catellatospora aurea]|uniref:Helix-turn-helix domain-containing protein n=1 Tax=Catellatospora aurea TaxID=1337874 RepID=A0ABW2H730_9ACTN